MDTPLTPGEPVASPGPSTVSSALAPQRTEQERTSPLSREKTLANLHRAPINPGEFRNRCQFCESTFQKVEHLKRHERSHTKERPYVCSVCGKKFTRGDSLTRHLRLHEDGNVMMGMGVEEGEEDEDSAEPKSKKKKASDSGEDRGKGKRGKTTNLDRGPSPGQGDRPRQGGYGDVDLPMVRYEQDSHSLLLMDGSRIGNQDGPPLGTIKLPYEPPIYYSHSRSPHNAGLMLDPSLASHGRAEHEVPRHGKKRRLSPSTPRDESFPPFATGGSNDHVPYDRSHYNEFVSPSAPLPGHIVSNGFRNMPGHRSSVTLSDLYANPTHAESVRSTYQHEWSSRSQTGERDTGDEDRSSLADRAQRSEETGSTPGPFSVPHSSGSLGRTMDGQPLPETQQRSYNSPHSLLSNQFSGFTQASLNSLGHDMNHPFPGNQSTANASANDRSPNTHGVPHHGSSDQDRLQAEVDKEIGIANADGVFALHESPHTGAATEGPQPAYMQTMPLSNIPSVPNFFETAGPSGTVYNADSTTGFEGMDFSSFGSFDFSSPTHLDLLQLLASDGSLAFGHTLIPQFHTYTRRNSPVLESSCANPVAGSNFEIGESAFPGTQLARHPHMEIDVNTWGLDGLTGRPVSGEGGSVENASSSFPTNVGHPNPGDVDLSQFGVSMDIAHFWSSLMGHGHAPGLQQAPQQPDVPNFGAIALGENTVGQGQLMGVTDSHPQRTPHKPGVTSETPVSRGNAHGDGQEGASADRKPADIPTAGKRSISLDTPPFSLSGSSGRPQEAINEARCLITDLSFNLNASTSPLTSSFLDLCLTSFFARFLPTFNVIHRPTFSVRQAPAPLLINMIALGSLYVPAPDAKEKGEALWRLVYKGVGASWDRLMELRNGPHDHTKGTPLVQTIMLGQLFAALSSKQSVRRSPFTFQGLGLRIARLCGMYLNTSITCDIQVPTDECSEAELDIAWRIWAARETQLRALLGSMVVDGQFMSLFHTGTTVRHLCNEFPAPCVDALWNAANATQWREQVKRHMHLQDVRRKQTFASIYRKLLDEQHGGLDITLQYPLTPLGKATLIVGLSSVIADCRESRQLDQIYGQHPPLVLVTALRRLYRQLLQDVKSPVESIGLRMGWHDLCLQFLLSQSVDKTAMRATASRPPAVPDNLPVCDETYSYTRTSVGRRILLHANAIRQLAEKFPFSAMTSPQFFIPRFCHSAALSLLAFVKGNKDRTASLAHRTYDLHREIDWDALGSFGFSPSDRLTSYDAQSSTSIDKEFISQGGMVELNGHPLQEEDLANFVIWLKSFGNIYGIAQVYSEDVQRRMSE